jgi:hypothetical protein
MDLSAERFAALVDYVNRNKSLTFSQIAREFKMPNDQSERMIRFFISQTCLGGFVNWDAETFHLSENSDGQKTVCPDCGGIFHLGSDGRNVCASCGTEFIPHEDSGLGIPGFDVVDFIVGFSVLVSFGWLLTLIANFGIFISGPSLLVTAFVYFSASFLIAPFSYSIAQLFLGEKYVNRPHGVFGRGRVSEFNEANLISRLWQDGRMSFIELAYAFGVSEETLIMAIKDIFQSQSACGYVNFPKGFVKLEDPKGAFSPNCPNCGGELPDVPRGQLKCAYCATDIFRPFGPDTQWEAELKTANRILPQLLIPIKRGLGNLDMLEPLDAFVIVMLIGGTLLYGGLGLLFDSVATSASQPGMTITYWWGFGLFILLGVPITLGGYWYLKSKPTKDMLIWEEQRTLFFLNHTGDTTINNLVEATKIPKKRVLMHLANLKERGEFDPKLDLRTGAMRGAKSAIANKMSCSNCGGKLIADDKGIIKCPYCGTGVPLRP